MVDFSGTGSVGAFPFLLFRWPLKKFRPEPRLDLERGKMPEMNFLLEMLWHGGQSDGALCQRTGFDPKL